MSRKIQGDIGGRETAEDNSTDHVRVSTEPNPSSKVVDVKDTNGFSDRAFVAANVSQVTLCIDL